MKTALRIIASTVLAPVIMMLILVITGFSEIIIKDTFIPWIIQIIICIGIIPVLIKLEKKFIPGYWALACNGAYFISGIISGYFILPYFIGIYMSEYYDLLHPWDSSGFLRASQVILHWLTVFAQLGLHLAVRLIIASVRESDKNHKEQEN